MRETGAGLLSARRTGPEAGKGSVQQALRLRSPLSDPRVGDEGHRETDVDPTVAMKHAIHRAARSATKMAGNFQDPSVGTANRAMSGGNDMGA